MYKAWRDMTVEERSKELWNRAGRPRMIWDSQRRGMFERSNLDSVAIMQNAEQEWKEILNYE